MNSPQNELEQENHEDTVLFNTIPAWPLNFSTILSTQLNKQFSTVHFYQLWRNSCLNENQCSCYLDGQQCTIVTWLIKPITEPYFNLFADLSLKKSSHLTTRYRDPFLQKIASSCIKSFKSTNKTFHFGLDVAALDKKSIASQSVGSMMFRKVIFSEKLGRDIFDGIVTWHVWWWWSSSEMAALYYRWMMKALHSVTRLLLQRTVRVKDL